MGTLFKKKGSQQWQMGVCVAGRQICKSTHTTKRSIARNLLARWETEVFEGRFRLPRTTPPSFEDWADHFLLKIAHPNTHRRYSSSVDKLKAAFAGLRLTDISPEKIEQYQERRIAEVEAATVNHDLRVLRRMLRLAERKDLIVQNPFTRIEFLRQKTPRLPHILTFAEEEKLLGVAVPYLRMLVILILETGMRSHREALPLRWDAIDFIRDLIQVRESKTRAGVRNVPLSTRCKTELLAWKKSLGQDFSPFVFPNFHSPERPLRDVRHSWTKALKEAGLGYFWIYNLRHTFCSRLSAVGVSDLFVAQMIGHSSPGILQIYSKAIDEYRREAVKKLEQLRYTQNDSVLPTLASTPLVN